MPLDPPYFLPHAALERAHHEWVLLCDRDGEIIDVDSEPRREGSGAPALTPDALIRLAHSLLRAANNSGRHEGRKTHEEQRPVRRYGEIVDNCAVVWRDRQGHRPRPERRLAAVAVHHVAKNLVEWVRPRCNRRVRARLTGKWLRITAPGGRNLVKEWRE